MVHGLTHNEKVYLELGREIVAMIAELKVSTPPGDAGYSRRKFTARGGVEIYMLLCTTAELAAIMEEAADEYYVIENAAPSSRGN